MLIATFILGSGIGLFLGMRLQSTFNTGRLNRAIDAAFFQCPYESTRLEHRAYMNALNRIYNEYESEIRNVE
jgi:hypothetical protein